jgi:hypothetical protein
MPSRKTTISSWFLFIVVISAALLGCSRREQTQRPQLLMEQQPKIAATLSTPPSGPPELRPPQPTEAQEVIKRIYGQTVFVESSLPQYFVAGDLNGDGSPDLAVAVRPTPGHLAELNHELANWIRCDPQKVNPPVPQRHGRILPQMVEPTVIEQHDLLLAIVHGNGPQGWRSPHARQTYLLKNAVGSGIKLTPFDEAVKMVVKYKNPLQLRGDVVSETLDNHQGLIYYTGAKYAWLRLGTTGP